MDEKTVGFLANPMGRIINWHQGQKLQTNSLVQWVAEAHSQIWASNLPNYQSARITVPSDMNITNWKTLMANHPDGILTQYLEFGFPLTVDREKFEPNTVTVNNPSAQKFPGDVDIYLRKEVQHKAMVGPFQSKIILNLHISPIMSRPKLNASWRIIVDLSWPHGASVNSAMPDNLFDNQEFKLKYPTIDDIVHRVIAVGRSAKLYKIDIVVPFVIYVWILRIMISWVLRITNNFTSI